jgi:thymidylate synthase (FAD)
MSARYGPLPDLNYVPTVERLLQNSKENKQAGVVKGAAELTPEAAETFRAELARMYREQEELYQEALRHGVPKELARVHLPVGRFTRMRASANLRNWLGFLSLRMDPTAQWEIQQYAHAVGEIVASTFPRTWALFGEGRL